MSRIYEYLKEKANGIDKDRYFLDYTMHDEKIEKHLSDDFNKAKLKLEKYTYKELYELVNKCISFLQQNKNYFIDDICFLIVNEDVFDFVSFIACLEVGLKPLLIKRSTLYNWFLTNKVKSNPQLYTNVPMQHSVFPAISISNNEVQYGTIYDLRKGENKLGIHVPDKLIYYLIMNNVYFESFKDHNFDFGMLSSGTTNKSKIIPIKENELVSAILKKYELSNEETYITAMPISAISGLLFSLYLPIIGNNKTICIEKIKIYPEFFDYKHLNIILPSNYMRRDGFNNTSFMPLITQDTISDRIDHITLLGDKVHSETIEYFHDLLPGMPKDLVECYYGRTENFGLVSKINEKDMQPVYLFFQNIDTNRIIYTFDKENIYEDIMIDGKRITRKSDIIYDDNCFYEVMPIGILNALNEDIKIKEELFSNIVADGKITDDIGFTLNNKIYYVGRESEFLKRDNNYFFVTALENKLSPVGIDNFHCIPTDDGINIYVNCSTAYYFPNEYRKSIINYKDILLFAKSFPSVKDIYFIEKHDVPIVGSGGKVSRKKFLDFITKYDYGKFDINFDFKKVVESIISETIKRKVNLSMDNDYFIFPKSLFSINDIVKVVYLFRISDYRVDDDNYYLAINDEFLFVKDKKNVRNTINEISKLTENDAEFNDYAMMIKTGCIDRFLMSVNESAEKKHLVIYLMKTEDGLVVEPISEIEEYPKTRDNIEYMSGVIRYEFDVEVNKYNYGFDYGIYKLDNENNFYVGNKKYDIIATSPTLYKIMYNFLLNQKDKDKGQIKVLK